MCSHFLYNLAQAADRERERNFATTTAGDGAWQAALDKRGGHLKSGVNSSLAANYTM